MENEKVTPGQWTVVGSVIMILLLVIIFLFMWGCPTYNVWQKTLEGEAELKKAEWSRQIAVREAQAKLDSSKMLAEAEIQRAKGTAEANKIIGDSLKNNEAYLRYLWIHNLEEGKNEVIYIPTEAGMPILEAGKR